MATYWTIVVGGVEKAIGPSDPTLGPVCADVQADWASQAPGTLVMRTAERFDPGAAQWSGPAVSAGPPPTIQHNHAIVWRDRALSGGVFSGGSIYFQGYFDDPERLSDGGKENVRYVLRDVLWLFARQKFKQHRNGFAGTFSSTNQRVVNVSVAAGGAGYALGDVLTAAGGTGTGAQFAVAAISGGGATGPATLLVLANGGGSYTANPASPNSPTGGTGTGLSVNLVFAAAPNLVDQVATEIYLGEAINIAGGFTTRQSTGAQIGEVVDWVNSTYNPTRHPGGGPVDATQDVVQKGTIDPNTLMPISRYNSISCLQAIVDCFKFEPDAMLTLDDTTTPPTLGVRKLGTWNTGTVPPTFLGYRAADLTITLTADQEKQMSLKSQVSKNLPGVIIYYTSINMSGNVVMPSLVVDKFPSSVTDYTPEVDSHTVALAGSDVKIEAVTIQGVAISDATSGTLANRQNWWKAHDATLPEANIDATTITPGVATVTDPVSGSAINTSIYQWEVDVKALPDWLQGSVVAAKVSATMGLIRYANAVGGIQEHVQASKTHNKTVMLTNVAPGPYARISSMTTGEVVPQGVAESIYRSLAAGQYGGRVTFVNGQLRSDLKVGMIVTLQGPNTTFTKCMVQAISARPHTGETTVTFGPTSPVVLETWLEIARALMTRTTWNFPSGRGDGGTGQGSAASAQSGSSAPKQDTVNGVGGFSYDTPSYRQV